LKYPHGFEGFEPQEDRLGIHPTPQDMQSYCKASLNSFAEMGQDEFTKIEGHVAGCESCLSTLVAARLEMLGEE
jgi:hypothetical protein